MHGGQAGGAGGIYGQGGTEKIEDVVNAVSGDGQGGTGHVVSWEGTVDEKTDDSKA